MGQLVASAQGSQQRFWNVNVRTAMRDSEHCPWWQVGSLCKMPTRFASVKHLCHLKQEQFVQPQRKDAIEELEVKHKLEFLTGLREPRRFF